MNKPYSYFHIRCQEEKASNINKFSLDIEIIEEKATSSYRWGLIFSSISDKPSEKAYKAFEDNLETKIYSLFKVYEVPETDMNQNIQRICKEIYILKALEEQKLSNFSKLRSILCLGENAESEIPKAFLLYLDYQDFSLKEILQFRLENKTPYKENELLAAFKELIRIFKTFYEECSLVHRDIKIENILYSIKSNNYIITDFSESKFVNKEHVESITGTPLYYTLENFAAYSKRDMKNKTSLVENDIYALGIVFLLMKKQLVYQELTREIINNAAKSLENDHNLSSKIITAMLEENPAKRETYFSLINKVQGVKGDKNPEGQIIMKLEEFYIIKSKDLRKQADNSLEIGLALILINQLEKGMEQLNKAKSLFVSIKDEKKKALTMFYIGKIYHKLGLIEKAGDEIEPIFEDIKKLLSNEDQNLGLEILAVYYQKKKKWVDSIICYEDMMGVIEKKQGGFALKLGEYNEKLGDIYENMGQNEEACKRWNEAIGILRKNQGHDDHINLIYDKIYKYHPSEMYEDNDSDFSMSVRQGRSSTSKHPALDLSKEMKRVRGSYNDNELQIPKNEKAQKMSVFSVGGASENLPSHRNSKLLDKSGAFCLINKDPEFEKGLLFINRDNFPPNAKNAIKFEQTPEQFTESCLKKNEAVIYQNEFLCITGKETAFIRKNEMEYDLILDLKYENRSKISKISNIYSKFHSDYQGVFLNVQQLKGNELESLQSVSHLVFVKFKALKFEIPVMFFFGK